MLQEMKKQGFILTAEIYALLINAARLGHIPDPGFVSQVTKEMEERGVKRSAEVYVALMRFYEKDESTVLALWNRMLQEGIEPDIVVYNVFLEISDTQTAYEIFEAIKDDTTVKPNRKTYSIILDKLEKASAYSLMNHIQEEYLGLLGGRSPTITSDRTETEAEEEFQIKKDTTTVGNRSSQEALIDKLGI